MPPHPTFFQLRWGLKNFVYPSMASNHDLPNVSLPSNLDYRHEPPEPSSEKNFDKPEID
jgi:hypothetical protein